MMMPKKMMMMMMMDVETRKKRKDSCRDARRRRRRMHRRCTALPNLTSDTISLRLLIWFEFPANFFSKFCREIDGEVHTSPMVYETSTFISRKIHELRDSFPNVQVSSGGAASLASPSYYCLTNDCLSRLCLLRRSARKVMEGSNANHDLLFQIG